MVYACVGGMDGASDAEAYSVEATSVESFAPLTLTTNHGIRADCLFLPSFRRGKGQDLLNSGPYRNIRPWSNGL